MEDNLVRCFRIEKDVPYTKIGGRWAFMEKMQVGDSFLLPEKDRGNMRPMVKRLGFIVRLSKINQPEGFMRCWRVG